jgi:hypothetical protein
LFLIAQQKFFTLRVEAIKRKYNLFILFIVQSISTKKEMATKKVLFVLTSHGTFPDGHPTGWYLPEVC